MTLYKKQLADIVDSMPWPVGFTGGLSLDGTALVISAKNIKAACTSIEEVLRFQETMGNCMVKLRILNPAITLRVID